MEPLYGLASSRSRFPDPIQMVVGSRRYSLCLNINYVLVLYIALEMTASLCFSFPQIY